MLKINTQELIQNLVKKGMLQAHMVYDYTICKGSKIPSALKKSIKENSSNFFDGGSEIDYLVLKVPEARKEPSDATSKIVQLIKTNFLDGDPSNTFTTSDVQVGYIELKKTIDKAEEVSDESGETEEKAEEEVEVQKRMFYVIKYKIVD